MSAQHKSPTAMSLFDAAFVTNGKQRCRYRALLRKAAERQAAAQAAVAAEPQKAAAARRGACAYARTEKAFARTRYRRSA